MQALLGLSLVLLAEQQSLALGRKALCLVREALRLVVDRMLVRGMLGLLGLLAVLEKVAGTSSAAVGCAVALTSGDTVTNSCQIPSRPTPCRLGGVVLTVQHPDGPESPLDQRSWPCCPDHHYRDFESVCPLLEFIEDSKS